MANGDLPARRKEIIATIGVFGAQAIGVAVWLGSEHSARVALEQRIERAERDVQRLDTRGGRQLGIVTEHQQRILVQVPDLYEKLYKLQTEVALIRAGSPAK